MNFMISFSSLFLLHSPQKRSFPFMQGVRNHRRPSMGLGLRRLYPIIEYLGLSLSSPVYSNFLLMQSYSSWDSAIHVRDPTGVPGSQLQLSKILVLVGMRKMSQQMKSLSPICLSVFFPNSQVKEKIFWKSVCFNICHSY